jgi:cell division protein FtsL
VRLAHPGLVSLCAAAVVASAIGVVYAKYASRKYFMELQELRHQRDLVEIEWSQLQLEQGTLATHTRIDQLARERLKMHVPTPDRVVVIAP